MVNVWGEGIKRGPPGPPGEEGPPGKRGPKGDPGFDMVKWLPIFTLKQFRKSEDCCLMITNPAKDLDGYTKWKSRSDNHHDAVAIRASDKYHEIGHNRWALNFKNNLYSIDHVSLTSANNIFLFLTFQTFSTEEQIVISDYSDKFPIWRGVSISSTYIKIFGADNKDGYIQIPFTVKGWITLVVIWGGTDKSSSYIINGKVSSFRANNVGIMMSTTMSLGDINNEKLSKPLNGAISTMDLFEGEFSLPTNLQNLIINNHIVEEDKVVYT